VNRDPLGKEPKGSLFLKGGLSAVDEFLSRGTREGVVYFPLSVVTEERRTVKRIKAELLFYSVELNMMRSKLANATKVYTFLSDNCIRYQKATHRFSINSLITLLMNTLNFG